MKRVLIVEDDPYLLDFYEQMRANLGEKIHLHVAAGGSEALEMLEKELFDLMLLDLIMPEVDGYAVLEHLRKKGAKDLTVFVFTNLDTDEDRKRSQELGVEQYYVKADLSHRMLQNILTEAVA